MVVLPFLANMGAFALGSVLSWTATALPSMEDLGDFHINSDDQSWIAAMATVCTWWNHNENSKVKLENS